MFYKGLLLRDIFGAALQPWPLPLLTNRRRGTWVILKIAFWMVEILTLYENFFRDSACPIIWSCKTTSSLVIGGISYTLLRRHLHVLIKSRTTSVPLLSPGKLIKYPKRDARGTFALLKFWCGAYVLDDTGSCRKSECLLDDIIM